MPLSSVLIHLVFSQLVTKYRTLRENLTLIMSSFLFTVDGVVCKEYRTLREI
jgi:hypothetical protein